MKDKEETVKKRRGGEGEPSQFRNMDCNPNEWRRPDPPGRNGPQINMGRNETSGILIGKNSNPSATRTCNSGAKDNVSTRHMTKSLELNVQIPAPGSYDNENIQSSLTDFPIEFYHSLVGDERDRLLPPRIDNILASQKAGLKSSFRDGMEMESFRGRRIRNHRGYHRWPSSSDCRCDDNLSRHTEEGFDNLSEDFIDQSLKEVREECQNIQNENDGSHMENPMATYNAHSSASCANGSLNPLFPMSQSSNIQIRNRIGSADADVEHRRRSTFLEGLLSTSELELSPMRARSYTSPPEINLLSADNNSSRQNFREYGQRSSSHRSQSTNADTNSTSRRPSSSLLSSLDSGMNTLRRWMNSQTYVPGHAPATMIPRQSNAVLDLSLEGEGEGEGHIVMNTGTSLPWMPDRIDSKSFTGSHSTALDNILKSRDDRTVTSASTGTNNSASEVGGGEGNPGSFISYPQTIQEEDEYSAPRQRAFSEPERPKRLWMAFSRRRKNRVSGRNSDGNRDISGLRNVHNARDVFCPVTSNEDRSHGDAIVILEGLDESSAAQSTPPFVDSLHQERGANCLPSELMSDIGHSSHSRLDRVPSQLEGGDEEYHGNVLDHGITILPPPRDSHSTNLQAHQHNISDLETGHSSQSRLDRAPSRLEGDEENHGNVLEHGTTMQSPPQDSHSTNLQAHQHNITDPNREARRTWIVINQRFQLFAVLVGITFSLLRFSIMITWVVLTSAYVVSIDEECDLPLKLYFWFATIQLILDVFRKDIMRYIFRIDANRIDHQNIPSRVIFYNLAYITYAMLVLRLGIRVIFLSHGGCRHTATKLFNTTRVYVIMSICAWMLVLFGYFIPFCGVAIALTRNGYSPAIEGDTYRAETGNRFGVFPGVNSAPPGCIDRLKVLKLDDFLSEYPRDCCICMTDFTTSDSIVATECEHVFHKRCCQEWLKQARTCPVCRSDIPSSLGLEEEEALEETVLDDNVGSIFTTGPFHSQDLQRDLINLVSMLTRDPTRIR